MMGWVEGWKNGRVEEWMDGMKHIWKSKQTVVCYGLFRRISCSHCVVSRCSRAKRNGGTAPLLHFQCKEPQPELA
ncbi:MAG: hypothetical protein DRP71_13190 [Verrucomicrobia bacterium]|nr:MAG: hypothetical protein DRP71_13190 [Verrucomicrobiota bacterium]